VRDLDEARAARAAAAPASTEPETVPAVATDTGRTSDPVTCPKCGGRMWDNRISKRNPKAPDFKCRDRSCDGVIWPLRAEKSNGRQPVSAGGPLPGESDDALPGALEDGDDDLPF
jgi:hypothetical protein